MQYAGAVALLGIAFGTISGLFLIRLVQTFGDSLMLTLRNLFRTLWTKFLNFSSEERKLGEKEANTLAENQNRPALELVVVNTNDLPNKPPEILRMSQIEDQVAQAAKRSREPERKAVSKMELWYPGASIKKGQKTQGKYLMGHPQGAIIHFTAGRRSYKGRKDYETGEQAMENSIAEKSYTYFVIGMDGTVWQSVPIDRWGYHAGKAYHSKLNTTDVSSRCVGIEICNAGLLQYGTAWFKESFPETEIRILKPGEYQNCKRGGQFLKYTAAQEESLEDLLLWLNNNSAVFSLDCVYGHDEVAPDRKTDPGGALSMSMPDYRKYLIEKSQQV
jgi:hypothetical protein